MFAIISLCYLVSVSLGAFSFPSLNPGFRYTLPVDTCIANVSVSGNTYYGGDGGSMICRCNEQNRPTESTVMCNFYQNDDCTGELDDTQLWGGCASDQYLYRVDNCSFAQEQAADPDQGCQYWVADTSSTDLNQVVTPLYQCMDYNCDGNNNAEASQSCLYACSTADDEVQERFYDNYFCEGNPTINRLSYAERECTTNSGPGCGVIITRYDISGSYNCGSKKSPFKTSSSNGNVKYFMEANRNIPTPIGACFETRNGFYSYSYEYECEYDKTTMMSTVMKKVYLGSSNCKGNDYYVSRNYSSLNHTVSCTGSSGKGSYGTYASCNDNNWDAYYSDTPMLFGQCVPFMMDPDTVGFDDGKIADRPWNENLRVVFSCNLRKRYLSAYFYIDENCNGDYLFSWDWDDDYDNYNSWGNRQCGRPEIKNCGNSADTATNKIGQQL